MLAPSSFMQKSNVKREEASLQNCALNQNVSLHVGIDLQIQIAGLSS